LEITISTANHKKGSENPEGGDNTERIGEGIIASFTLPQCQSLLWDQINEKALLLERIRAGLLEQDDASKQVFVYLSTLICMFTFKNIQVYG
jgi:hypothetical protein